MPVCNHRSYSYCVLFSLSLSLSLLSSHFNVYPSILSLYLSVCVWPEGIGDCVYTLLSYSFDVTFQVVAFINNNTHTKKKTYVQLFLVIMCSASQGPTDWIYIYIYTVFYSLRRRGGRLSPSSIGILLQTHTSLCVAAARTLIY